MSRYHAIQQPPPKQTEQTAKHLHQDWQQAPPPRQSTRQPAPPVYDVDLPEDDIDWDKVYSTRSNTSTRRYQVPVTQGPRHLVIHDQRRKKPTPQAPDQVPTPRPSAPVQARHVPWYVVMVAGMLIVVIVLILYMIVVGMWQSWQDDLHYGRPRTFQCDARVGHNDAQTPSHFIALNLNGHVTIVEFPGNDTSKPIVYAGPALFGTGQDLTPVTLSFKDLNGDGKPDMIVTIQGNGQTVFINEGNRFRPATSQDHISL